MKYFGHIYYLQLEIDKGKLIIIMVMNYKAEVLGVYEAKVFAIFFKFTMVVNIPLKEKVTPKTV